MRIRSVTVFTTLDPLDPAPALEQAGKVAATARRGLKSHGYEVQTLRVALPAIETWAPDRSVEELLSLARDLDRAAGAAGIDYVCLGPLLIAANSDRRPLQALPSIIQETDRLFASAFIADTQGNILTSALEHIAEVILVVAESRPDGFGNLRFAALANCMPGTPFFPAAYCLDGDFSFALAPEAADLALDACRAASGPSDALRRLQIVLESHARDLEFVMQSLEQEAGAPFSGCDWSLAPHPDPARSVGAAVEALSGMPFGGWGTLGAVATLTRAVRRVSARRVGFSGVFLPVLEDRVLAERAAAGSYSLKELLSYCAVCGTGLDTVPLAGDVSIEAIAALLGDVAALATVLNKPLTVRLMPVPGLQAGEMTRFDFPYLVNAPAFALGEAGQGLLRDEVLSLARNQMGGAGASSEHPL
ncbi:MAG: hypothetical protein KatS3mg057_0475 [Herpetosiphonaceae bacterium]|nr:MAG: hypothetical protein KatS3mg057_0475 [Herpetosiphonaceae bacterium]